MPDLFRRLLGQPEEHAGLEQLRVVIFASSGCWFAQGVELDLIGRGEDPKSALDALVRVVKIRPSFDRQLGLQPFVKVPPAPEQFSNDWSESPDNIDSFQIELGDSSLLILPKLRVEHHAILRRA